jgi:outer membrane lipoprotein-sorting protein
MSAQPAWDRAGSLPVPASGRPRPELVALGAGPPTLDELFTFMRDAELRFATLRMRIEERARTTRGDEVTLHEVMLRHPGEAKVLRSVPEAGTTGSHQVWISDGTTVRTYTASRKVGTRRPVRPTVVGATDNRDLPGQSRVYLPLTALPAESLPDLFVHPAGYCQNVLGTGACEVTGTSTVAGREGIVVDCAHPRSIERIADRPDFSVRVTVDRADGIILRLEERFGDTLARDAIVTSYAPDAALPPSAFEFTFPSDTTFIY